MQDDLNIDISESNVELEIMQSIQKIETGKYLESLRKAKRLSRQSLSGLIGISANYINEIERGYKTPSDILIRKFAAVFNINESDLFTRYGKISLTAREEFESNNFLQKLSIEIAQNKTLTNDQKESIYEKLYQQYLLLVSQYNNMED